MGGEGNPFGTVQEVHFCPHDFNTFWYLILMSPLSFSLFYVNSLYISSLLSLFLILSPFYFSSFIYSLNIPILFIMTSLSLIFKLSYSFLSLFLMLSPFYFSSFIYSLNIPILFIMTSLSLIFKLSYSFLSLFLMLTPFYLFFPLKHAYKHDSLLLSISLFYIWQNFFYIRFNFSSFPGV